MKETCPSSANTYFKSILIVLAMFFALCVFAIPANAGEDSVFEKLGQNGEIILASAFKEIEVDLQSGSKVPNLPCNASYTRGSNATGAYVHVTAHDSQCKYFEGVYYWVPSYKFYCKNPSDCSREYLRNIPAP